MRYPQVSCFLFFGAFRALLKFDKEGNVKWLFDPIEIWEASGVRLVQNTF